MLLVDQQDLLDQCLSCKEGLLYCKGHLQIVPLLLSCQRQSSYTLSNSHSAVLSGEMMSDCGSSPIPVSGPAASCNKPVDMSTSELH